MKKVATLATQGCGKFHRLRKFCDQNHAFYVQKFKNTNRSVEAIISHQIVENVKPKDLQAEAKDNWKFPKLWEICGKFLP